MIGDYTVAGNNGREDIVNSGYYLVSYLHRLHAFSKDSRTSKCNTFSTHLNRMLSRRVLVAFLLAAVSSICSTTALSTNARKSSTMTRRDIIASLVVITTATSYIQPTYAACVQGDDSPECIGVYKITMDQANEMTEPVLEQYAPDIASSKKKVDSNSDKGKGWQSLQSKTDALNILQAQQQAAIDIKTVVSRGKLEEAGIKVLNLISKVTVAGQYIGRSGSDNSNNASIQQLRQQQYESQLQNVLWLWQECDVSLGQGIRGEMGVSAVAQLYILKEITEATRALDDFIMYASRI